MPSNSALVIRLAVLLVAGVAGPAVRCSAQSAPTLDPASVKRLEAYRGVHPRLLLDAARVAELREAIKTTHAALWKGAKEQADLLTRQKPPAYRGKTRYGPWDDGSSESWQQQVGLAMPRAAMAYLLTGEKEYLGAARDWALASCSYPTWGLGNLDGMDLAAGAQMYGLALVYDWCYADLDAKARQTIRTTLARRGRAMFEKFATGQFWSHDQYLQNHLWCSMRGLAAAGLALYDQEPDASQWIALVADKTRRTADALGPDGASHEGIVYWGYGLDFLMPTVCLLRELPGLDLHDRPWWRNTAAYRLYLGLPRGAWSHDTIVDIADCERQVGWTNYCQLCELRRLAADFGDGHAQWLAARLDESTSGNVPPGWTALLWYDPKVAEKSPADLPTLHHFDDMGIVSARSGWSGNESLVVVKCGPCMGFEAMKKFDYAAGAGHVHPDAGHFVIFAEDEWQIIDDGYCRKLTSQHNALLIDGRGQVGEGEQWFDGKAAFAAHCAPSVTRATSTSVLDHVACNVASAYPADSGLKRWVRHVIFLKPDVVIVADDVELDAARDLELRFHTERPAERGDGGAWYARSTKSVLRLEPLTPADVNAVLGTEVTDRRFADRPKELGSLRLGVHRAAWRNAVAISWSPAKSEPAQVRLSTRDAVWRFSVGGRAASLDWPTGQVEGSAK